jgi:hypothetical protein
LGDADDLVAGFFADRIGAPGFLADWRGSKMPLRRWLMNGISFYGRGVMRDRARDRMRQFEDGGAGFPGGAGDSSTHAGGEDRFVDERDAVRAFEEAWALEVLNAAHELVHANLAERGKLEEYGVFRRHVIDGVEYAVIGTDLGLTRQQCANMVRRVSDRIREALREQSQDLAETTERARSRAAEIRAILADQTGALVEATEKALAKATAKATAKASAKAAVKFAANAASAAPKTPESTVVEATAALPAAPPVSPPVAKLADKPAPPAGAAPAPAPAQGDIATLLAEPAARPWYRRPMLWAFLVLILLAAGGAWWFPFRRTEATRTE